VIIAPIDDEDANGSDSLNGKRATCDCEADKGAQKTARR